MKIVALHHVNLGVTDIDAARRFYGGILGLQEIPRTNASGAWFAVRDGGQIHVSAEPSVAPHERRHVALDVDDMDATTLELEAAGVAVERVPPFPGAGRQVLIRDPDGNLIELRVSRT